jgi:hypothetical protein
MPIEGVDNDLGNCSCLIGLGVNFINKVMITSFVLVVWPLPDCLFLPLIEGLPSPLVPLLSSYSSSSAFFLAILNISYS